MEMLDQIRSKSSAAIHRPRAGILSHRQETPAVLLGTLMESNSSQGDDT